MVGDDDGLSPDAAPVHGSREHTRIADKKRFSDKPESGGVPDEEEITDRDVEAGLDGDPEDVSLNRRDVPDTPENSIEARTEGG